MSGCCPNCGFNIAADKPLIAGDWTIHPRGAAVWRGIEVTRRFSWVTILHTLAAAEGRVIRGEPLLARISNSENNNVLSVQLTRLRSEMKRLKVPNPIAVQRGPQGGYWWAPSNPYTINRRGI